MEKTTNKSTCIYRY